VNAVNDFATDLLDWSARTRRDLPWRRTRDPWAVLVSETMLQQTQAARVAPRYEEFLDCFPSPSACAAAPVGAVVAVWVGLGYNRRAVNLHAAATAIVAQHGGRVPDRLEQLVALPGVGAYTARAILAFAFERDAGVVDTNAARVLARAVAGSSLDRAAVQRLADSLVPAGNAWAWNQAVLDLGAVVCTARRPRCRACPVAGSCTWGRAGHPSPDPAVGSAGTSGRQTRFAGSDRQGRGRLVAALTRRPLAGAELAAVAGWPEDEQRARRVVATLVADGLAVRTPAGGLALPDHPPEYSGGWRPHHARPFGGSRSAFPSRSVV
jgi:A/G-specific adenine glycosylase